MSNKCTRLNCRPVNLKAADIEMFLVAFGTSILNHMTIIDGRFFIRDSFGKCPFNKDELCNVSEQKPEECREKEK